ncbi:MAG: type VI secretion system tip protein VgrG, partial [Aquabacterium sp.]|nr:type VI secretion system tip protein VgrG [Aquabacterium sp.]
LIQQAADAVNTSAWRGAWRGAGFELITQGWATLRAAGGMLVSSSERSGRSSHGSAESTQMDAAEAVGQLHGAQQVAQALSDSAQAQGAQPLAAHAQSVPELIRGIDAQQDGCYSTPLNGQDHRKGVRPGVVGAAPAGAEQTGLSSRSETGSATGLATGGASGAFSALPGSLHTASGHTASLDPVERPAAPTLTLDAAHSSLLATEATLAAYTGGDFALVSQGDAHATAAHTASTVVGGTASHYTHAGGMKLIAANGPWSLRAHTGALDVQADQELTVTSVGDEIHAAAQGRIVLTAGSSRVVLDGGNITFTCPGTFTVRAAAHAFEGPGSAEAALPYLPHQRLNEPTHWIDLSHRDPDGQPMAGQRYTIHFEGGTVVSGALNAAGQAHHDNVPARALRVEYEPRTPQPEPPWEPLQSLLGRAEESLQ